MGPSENFYFLFLFFPWVVTLRAPARARGAVMEKVKVPSVCGGWLAGRQSLQNLAPCCASACPLVILSGGFRFLFQLPTSHLFIHPLNLKTRQPALGSYVFSEFFFCIYTINRAGSPYSL